MKRYTIGTTLYKDEGKEYLPSTYLRAMDLFGGVACKLEAATPLEKVPGIVDALDGMLFTGGDDVSPALYGAVPEPETEGIDPKRDALEIRLLEECRKRGVPVFGICRGCQIINVALGGTLVQHVPRRFGRSHYMPKGTKNDFWHDVRVVPGTKVFSILGGDVPVDSYHHQCVDTLAPGLRACAYAPEGFIEAYEAEDDTAFLVGVQWHPEVTFSSDPYSRALFAAFGRAVASYSSSK